MNSIEFNTGIDTDYITDKIKYNAKNHSIACNTVVNELYSYHIYRKTLYRL